MALRQRLRMRKTGMRFFNAAHCLQYLAQVVMSLWGVGNQRACLPIVRGRAIEAMLRPTLAQAQRAPITFNGGAVIAGILACIARVAMCLGVCGTELYRALQHRQGVLALRLQSGVEADVNQPVQSQIIRCTGDVMKIQAFGRDAFFCKPPQQHVAELFTGHGSDDHSGLRYGT